MCFNYIICDEAPWLLRVYYDKDLAEGNRLIQVSAISILLCQKMIYQMRKKPSRCNGKLVLAKNKHKNVN